MSWIRVIGGSTVRPDDSLHRGDPRDRTGRDLERLARRRSPGLAASIALIGSVGWPIVLLAVGGAVLGRYLDSRWNLGIAATLILLFLGVGLGTYIAYRSVRGRS